MLSGKAESQTQSHEERRPHWGSPQLGNSERTEKEEGAWEGLGGRVTWSDPHSGKVSRTGPPLQDQRRRTQG